MAYPVRSVTAMFLLSGQTIDNINSFDLLMKELVFIIFQDIRNGDIQWEFPTEMVQKKLGNETRYDDFGTRVISICYNNDDLDAKIQSLLNRSEESENVKNAFLLTTIWNPLYEKVCKERSKEFVDRQLNFVCYHVTEDMILKRLG